MLKEGLIRRFFQKWQSASYDELAEAEKRRRVFKKSSSLKLHQVNWTMDVDIAIRIAREAQRFRRAIERCDTRRLPITMIDFPSGACGDAALLLAKHLQLAGIWPLIYVCGEMAIGRRNQSHAWLEYRDLIIDITADQFEDISGPVIVTTDRAWHGRFTVSLRIEADYNNWDGHVIDSLPNAFKVISSCLEPT